MIPHWVNAPLFFSFVSSLPILFSKNTTTPPKRPLRFSLFPAKSHRSSSLSPFQVYQLRPPMLENTSSDNFNKSPNLAEKDLPLVTILHSLPQVPEDVFPLELFERSSNHIILLFIMYIIDVRQILGRVVYYNFILLFMYVACY
ncbi:uncharacterized protein LOC107012593 [Solanum pennellii]|uniref:Uncharacterized protein LOC107012593 n=1 Tax=Solanum pennellii TaxID=28526 RepID=A0ABM1VGZ3_SOLPN|nr:uncharacterized protein LOC107012593 [Solanum pennellii]